MMSVDLHPTPCAICERDGNATELYPANFSPESFSPAIFSARRLPDRIHYRIVRCNTCGLVRSDPVANPETLAELYRLSSFDYDRELRNLGRTYGSYLSRLDRYGVQKGTILEIGCGNGFVLQQALAQGYREVCGVEPSQAAIHAAPEDIRQKIVCAMMKPGLFNEQSVDVICLFQALDHIADPADLLRTCLKTLRPGGFILCLNHNVDAVSARILKDRSPIIDIEHTYLYSPATIRRLFSKVGFDVVETGGVLNCYSLAYLTRLIPLPGRLKEYLIGILSRGRIGRLSISVPLGNVFVIARRP
jgi:SAM-dependent methyltransferase